MKHVKILDCTLRDGGLVVDMCFGTNVISGMIEKLYQANIDVIECGFLADIEYKEGYTLFKHVEQIIPFLPKNRDKETSFSALLDYGKYGIDNLSPFDGTSVDSIRVCFLKDDDRAGVAEYAREVIRKGYHVYLQPTSIVSYTDAELLELLEFVNDIKPYTFSIVDTFGSMYREDLQHIYSIVNKNLDLDINLGFHSHNNMQLSFALCQDFIQKSFGSRNVFVDTSIHGLGRGAGNACTELVINYLNERFGYNYDFGIIMDIVDIYMPSIMRRGKWGYSIPFMIAGKLNSHVNNVSYLLDKHSILSNDLLQIIAKIDDVNRKKYDYDFLEQLYISHFGKKLDDEFNLHAIQKLLDNRNVLLIAPGRMVEAQKDRIDTYIANNHPVVIDVNIINPNFIPDFVFFSNNRRYEKGRTESNLFHQIPKIMTSNVRVSPTDKDYIISFNRLIKTGWKNFDNSLMLLLRLLDNCVPLEIAIAGFDGFSYQKNFIADMDKFEPLRGNEEQEILNQDLTEMLQDYKKTRTMSTPVQFVTDSIFHEIFL